MYCSLHVLSPPCRLGAPLVLASSEANNESPFSQELPPKKNFIRALSHVTGFLIRSSANGCELIYVTQSDPRGVYMYVIMGISPMMIEAEYGCDPKGILDCLLC